MDEMIDRVAKAMAAKEGWRWEDDRQMLDCAAAGLQNTSRERDSWRNRARAAIEAMRLPTDAMIESADRNVRPDSDNLQCPNWYTAAIDAALSTPLASEGGTDAASD